MALPALTPPPPAPSRLDLSPDFVAKADAFVAWYETHVAELNLYTAELPSVISGTDFAGTSTTSLAIGTGSKTFAASAGRNWQIGQPVRAAYTTTPANYMDGQVTAYNSVTGALTVNVTAVGGAGTYANWTISLIPGAGGSYVTATGAQTVDGKTLTNTTMASFLSGGFVITVPGVAMTLLGRTEVATVTNKSINFGDNTISFTIAQLNSACSDADLATKDGVETHTNKTHDGAVLRANVSVDDTGTIFETSVGFRGIPVSANGSGLIALSDIGKAIQTTGNWVIPANASVAFPIGSTIMFENMGGATLTIGITSDTLRWSGTTSTGTRTLAAYGGATIRKVSATEWRIRGDIS